MKNIYNIGWNGSHEYYFGDQDISNILFLQHFNIRYGPISINIRKI